MRQPRNRIEAVCDFLTSYNLKMLQILCADHAKCCLGCDQCKAKVSSCILYRVQLGNVCVAQFADILHLDLFIEAVHCEYKSFALLCPGKARLAKNPQHAFSGLSLRQSDRCQ